MSSPSDLRDAAEKKLREELKWGLDPPMPSGWLGKLWQKAISLQAEKDALEGALRECVRVFGRINRGLLDHEISAEVYAVELNSKAALKGDKKL